MRSWGKCFNCFSNTYLNIRFMMNRNQQILYLVTVLSFSSINFLNVTYSFLKRFIQQEFQMNSTEIGLADALKFFGNMVGLIFYINSYATKKTNIPYFYGLSIALNALFLGVIPFVSLLNYHQNWVVYTFNFCGGVAKAPSWPLLLQLAKQTIFSNKYNLQTYRMNKNLENRLKSQMERGQTKQNAKKFIVWTSLTLIGNIFGLVVSQNLIYKLAVPWNICLLIPVVCILFSSMLLCLYFYLANLQQDNGQNKIQSVERIGNKPQSNRQIVVRCLNLLFFTKNCTFIWSLVLLLSIHSIMMMFLPLFLFKIGYHQYQGYILAWYNLWVIVGTYVITYINLQGFFNGFFNASKKQTQLKALQEQQNNDNIEWANNNQEIECANNNQEIIQPPKSLELLNFLSILLLLATCIVLIMMPCPYNCEQYGFQGQIDPMNYDNHYKLLWYFGLLGLLGFFLGGPLNKYESSQLLLVLAEFEDIFQLSQPTSVKCRKLVQTENQQMQKSQPSKIFIGVIQLVSYFTVMLFLILTGHIIETNILGFFQLTSILAAFLVVLDIIKIIEKKLQS